MASRGNAKETIERLVDWGYMHYMTVQQPPDCWGAYGSSRLSTWYRRSASHSPEERPPKEQATGNAIVDRKDSDLPSPTSTAP